MANINAIKISNHRSFSQSIILFMPTNENTKEINKEIAAIIINNLFFKFRENTSLKLDILMLHKYPELIKAQASFFIQFFLCLLTFPFVLLLIHG